MVQRWAWGPRVSRKRGGGPPWVSPWDKRERTERRRRARTLRPPRWEAGYVESATVVLEVLSLLLPHLGDWRPDVEAFANALRQYMRGEVYSDCEALQEWTAKKFFYEVEEAQVRAGERLRRPRDVHEGPDLAASILWDVTHAVSDEDTMESAAFHAVWVAEQMGFKLRGGPQW